MTHFRRLFSVLACLALGSASAAERNLTISDTIGRDWFAEPIRWELSFQPGEWKGDPFLVTRDGKPLMAQANIAEKHGDGTVKSAVILFVIDALAKDTAAAIRFEPGKAGPADTALVVTEEAGRLVLDNKLTAVRVLNRNEEKKTGGGEFSPILGVRTASGKWTGGGTYATQTAKPVSSMTELLEKGPVRLSARVTTTFDNGRTHIVMISLWAGSRSIEIDESFDVGPADKYQFKTYKDDKDELAWEWWSWYGDKDGTQEDHPNNWFISLNGPEFTGRSVTYWGDMSTDTDKGNMKERGRSDYQLGYATPRRLEKYLTGLWQWRPDAVTWYAAAVDTNAQSDAVALFTHTVRDWRNPNILPAPQGITLRTGVNDMRIISRHEGNRLEVQCPIGLGRRCWAIRCSTREEMMASRPGCNTSLDAERLQRQFGLDVTRKWVTDWSMTLDYPRLFIKPEQREAYYARLKGKGIDSPGNFLDTFLRSQDQAGFDKDWASVNQYADKDIAGYFSGTGAESSPAWMMGYWNGITVANGLDNLLGSPLCKPEQARALKKKLTILTYCLTSRDCWPDKQITYGWGSMNMPVGRWGGLVVMASALSDHPMAATWLRDAGRYFNMLLETEFAPDGTHISCPHYIGASSTSFYAWIALANSGKFGDVSKDPRLQRFARYYMQLMTPIDPRWGIRTLVNEGDTRPGSSPFPAILATLFQKTDPDLAGQLMQIWTDGGRDMSGGMGVPDSLIIDPNVPAVKPKLGPQVFSGFGAFLRYRDLGTPEEAYLAFIGGNFMIDHANTDQFGFHWHDKGVPLSIFCGSLYVPMTCTALSHNTISWDVRPGGAKDPGKGQPGNWYTDHNQPVVDLGGITPTLHYEIGWDKETQKINEIRGLVTLATDSPDAALIEGQVNVKALTEVPTKPANFEIAVAQQASPPPTKLAKPFTWTRRLLSVKASTAAGMNYLVIRDDFGGFAEKTPNFSYWALADDVALQGNRARFKGQLGVDTDMVVLSPGQSKLIPGTFTHDQCEPIVSARFQQKYGKAFVEKTVLCRVEGQKDQGFLVVLFPYKADEEKPTVEPWANGAGAKITWKGETHYVLLDITEREIKADGIQAKASVLVVKTRDKKNASLSLPAGGEAKFGKLKVKSDGGTAAASQLVDGDRHVVEAKQLTSAADVGKP